MSNCCRRQGLYLARDKLKETEALEMNLTLFRRSRGRENIIWTPILSAPPFNRGAWDPRA